MKGIFRSKYTLLVVYVLMAAVCIYLNLTSGSVDLSNIIVSAALFIVVLGLFIYAFSRFAVIDRMIDELNEAADTIRDDFGMKKQYLWRYYQSRDNLFTQDILRKKYAEYRAEIERLEMLSGDVYRCDIEDYVNQELIDDTIRRNVLNLVSGTMTGLGILGTFIGLTIGLQQFNTGNADEITRSIAPLIQGIKVAFHTSIYGMVFSLIFSFVYKNKIDQATDAMDRFLDAYDHYVVPDSKNESQRQMLAFQKTLADGMTEIGSSFSKVVADEVDSIMTPQMNRMNDTIEKFAYVASRAQVDGVNAIVEKFLGEMNRQLNGAFNELGRSMKETADFEKENRNYMRDILREMDGMSSDLEKTSALLQKTMENMGQYVEWMNQINASTADQLHAAENQLAAMAAQSEAQQEYMRQFVEYTREISDSSTKYSNAMADQLGYLQQMDSRISETAKKNMDDVFASAREASRKVAESAQSANAALIRNMESASETITRTVQSDANTMLRSSSSISGTMSQSAEDLMKAAQQMNTQLVESLNSTLEAYDKSLVRIVGQLNATASRIENATNKVPQVVSDAYEGMQKSFDLMARETAAMVRSMDQVRKQLKAQADGRTAE